MNETDKAILEAQKAIDEAVLKTARRIALRVTQAIILATPVDTGRARGNWIVSVDKPNTEQFPDKKDPTGMEAIAEATRTILLETKKVGVQIFLSNNLPYILPLNNGHSAQAPAGFVEKAIQAAVSAER